MGLLFWRKKPGIKTKEKYATLISLLIVCGLGWCRPVPSVVLRNSAEDLTGFPVAGMEPQQTESLISANKVARRGASSSPRNPPCSSLGKHAPCQDGWCCAD